MRRTLLLIFSVVIFIALTDPGLADRRSYVWTYEYLTMPKGKAELEHYLTLKLPDFSNKGKHLWEQRFEIEYGITDRWDVSIYQIFEQKDDGNFTYSAFQIRSRYRLFESGYYFLDPLLYFEYKRSTNLKRPNKLEGKIILAKDIGAFNAAFNFVESALFGGAKAEFESEYTLGANYQFSPVFKFGLELMGNFEMGNQASHYMGPTLSLASGKLWYTIGGLFGVTDASHDFRIRALLGIEL